MPDRKPSTVDAPDRVSPPEYEFADGPAQGIRAVLRDIEGAQPRYATVREPVDRPDWEWPDDTGEDPPVPVHVYRLSLADNTYHYERTIDSARRSYTCPDCGRTTCAPAEVHEGYCPTCRWRTRIPMYAVLRFPDPDHRPADFEGRWVERPMVHLNLPAGPWNAQATSDFERGLSGGYAQVFELRPVGICG